MFRLKFTNLSPAPRSECRADLRTAFFYLLISLLFCWRLLVPGFSFYRWDTIIYSWPLLGDARSQLLSGSIPFWTSSVCCGTDLLANINLGILYPLNFLVWFLPMNAGYCISLFLHTWLSLYAMHILVHRSFRLGRFAAFTAALAYATSGYSRAMWDSINFAALPWIPLGIALMLSARWNKRVIPSILGVTGCLAMMLLGGDFQAAVLWVPVAVIMAMCIRERKAALAVLACGTILAVLICAPQLVTAYKASLLSGRAGGIAFSEATERSFHPLRLIELVMPHAFGSHNKWFAPSLFGEGATRLSPWIGSFYIGTLLLLPVGLAWRKRHEPAVRWAVVITVLSILLSFGRFLPWFRFWLSIPVINNFRYPEKHLLWSTLGLAVLAGFGAQTLQGLWKSRKFFDVRCRMVLFWLLAAAAGHFAGFMLAGSTCSGVPAEQIDAWLRGRIFQFATIGIIALACTCFSKRTSSLALPGSMLAISLLLPWYVEKPLTSEWNPLEPVPAAAFIRNSCAPFGRVAAEHSIENIPLLEEWPTFGYQARKAVILPSRLAYNSARTWGLRTADGFSPIESGLMRELRTKRAMPPETSARAEDFGRFCRDSAVQWILTEADRVDQIKSIVPSAREHISWGGHGKRTVLLHVPDAKEARFIREECKGGDPPAVRDVWRLRPGEIRVDISPGAACMLAVSETWSPGWTARDESGYELDTVPVNKAFTGIAVPPGTRQVRLKYVPQGWKAGLVSMGIGFVITTILLVYNFRDNRKNIVLSPVLPMVLACIIFLALGINARNKWACTYDEGFHLTRGISRLLKSDSRMNYYHPPLQNMVCAWFSDLAHGDRVRLPETAGWKIADVQRFATEFAYVNRHIYPDLVKASRWGSMMFGLLLCIAGVYWAFRAGGPLAAWLAATGLACNPNILAHGNLTTTDMGITALVLAASLCVWLYVRSGNIGHLQIGGTLFAVSALSKFTGLIWFLSFLLIVLPALAILEKRGRPLLIFPVALLMFIFLLLCLYRFQVQEIRVHTPEWLAGTRCIAGRYIEGVLREGAHAITGHRAYFAGKYVFESTWKHMPLTLLVKHPALWSINAMLGIFFLVYKGRRRLLSSIIPFIPLVVFCALFITTNKLSLGIRHLIPIIPFLVLAASVMVGRIKAHLVSGTLAFALIGTSCAAIVLSFPAFLGYYPLWAGGHSKGHYWSVDSNYDWGQDLEYLEENWASTTSANGGAPPHLLYHGFVDPRVIYGLDVAEPSLCGYMHWYSMSHGPEDSYRDWKAALEQIEGTTVSSISTLRLHPFGIDFGYVTERPFAGKLGYSYYVYAGPQSTAHNP